MPLKCGQRTSYPSNDRSLHSHANHKRAVAARAPLDGAPRDSSSAEERRIVPTGSEVHNNRSTFLSSVADGERDHFSRLKRREEGACSDSSNSHGRRAVCEEKCARSASWRSHSFLGRWISSRVCAAAHQQRLHRAHESACRTPLIRAILNGQSELTA